MNTNNIFSSVQDRFPHTTSLDYAFNPDKYVEEEKAYRAELIKEFYSNDPSSLSDDESNSLRERAKKMDNLPSNCEILIKVILLVVLIVFVIIIIPIII